MLRLRPMTGFAVHVRVLAVFLRVQHVYVARFAGFVPGEMNRARGDLADRCSAIVPILPKGTRNDAPANEEKDEKRDNEESCKSKEVSGISHRSHPAEFPRDHIARATATAADVIRIIAGIA